MTVWSPDTCKCVITCDVAGEPATHISKCSFHAAATPSAIAVENRNKNGALNEVEKQFPGLTTDVGSPGKTCKWAMASDRAVEITITGITTAQRTTLTSTMTTKFGTTVRVL